MAGKSPTPSAENREYDPEYARLALEEFRRAADALKNTSDGIQSRANTILGFTGTILAVVLGTASHAVTSHADFGIPGMVFLVASMTAAVVTVISSGYQSINPSHLMLGPPAPMARVLGAYDYARRVNRRALRFKAMLLRLTVILLVVGVVLLLAAIAQGGLQFAPL